MIDTVTKLQEKVARRGINYSLDRLSYALEQLGNPHLFLSDNLDDIKTDSPGCRKDCQASPLVVHVAGTNGKGSVCHYITQGLIKMGQRVLTYTSPHIHRYNERFCLNGEAIDDTTFNRLFESVNVADKANDLSEYEVLTLMAFLAAKQMQVDVLVLETGLGGRLDATNVVKNSLAVITDIGLDHCDILGGTLTDIATEKAGIIKPNGVVVTHRDHELEVMSVIQDAAHQVDSKMVFCKNLGKTFMDRNRALAVAVLEVFGGVMYDLKERVDSDIGSAFRLWADVSDEQKIAVLEWIQHDCLPPNARCMSFQYRGVNCWVDVGHNQAAAKAILTQLTQRCPEYNGRFCWVLGMQRKKDPGAVIRWLLNQGQQILLCEFDPVIGIKLGDLPEDAQGQVKVWAFEDLINLDSIFFGSFYFIDKLLRE